MAIIVSAAWFLLRRRRAKKELEKATADEEAKGTADAKIVEMDASVPSELPTDKGDVELEAQHGENELLGQGSASGFVEAFELPGSEVLDLKGRGGDGGVDKEEEDGLVIRLVEEGPDAQVVREVPKT